MRYTVLLLVFLLAGCGVLFSYEWNTPVDYVQLYPGTKHDYQMRLQYRTRGADKLQVYDHMWSDWIPLYGSGSLLSAEGSEKSCCPEGWGFGCSPYEVRGSVELIGARAKVAIEILQKGIWKTYEFNGEYRVERPTGDPVTEVLAQGVHCLRL
jgi:hypothetical protein